MFFAKSAVSGVGIDLVKVARFSDFSTYSDKKLSRIFSKTEIEYCTSAPVLSAQRFAVTFAAKEAFYKALCARLDRFFSKKSVSFLRICSFVCVMRDARAPYFFWDVACAGSIGFAHTDVRLSLSHDGDYAQAFVVIVS